MSVITADGAPDVLVVDFELACLDLAAATAALRRKDTPAARVEVAYCRARIDKILDSRSAGVRASALSGPSSVAGTRIRQPMKTR